MSAVVSVRDLQFSYGSVEVLRDITFAVDKGDYVALAGPNGSGKTTLIKNILGLTEGLKGTVELFGQDLRSFDSWGRIGHLPQRIASFSPLFPATVREVVGLGLLPQKRLPKRFTKSDFVKIRETLGLMGIAELENKLIGELSGGQQQRVFLARALISGPELLILDEPSTALDPQSRESFFELIRKLNHADGMTIILITHDTASIGQYANKLLYLDKTIVYYGSFADFCVSPDMAKYFGHFIQHLICHQHE